MSLCPGVLLGLCGVVYRKGLSINFYLQSRDFFYRQNFHSVGIAFNLTSAKSFVFLTACYASKVLSRLWGTGAEKQSEV